MKLTGGQRAFIDFLPVSLVKTNVLRSFAITLFLIPIMVNYYFTMIDPNYRWWIYVVCSIDAFFLLATIPILIKPKFFLSVAHFFTGFLAIFSSIVFFIGFIFEANTIKLGIINIGFAFAIYVIAVFLINFLFIRANFSKHPKSSKKIAPIIMLSPIIGMMCYNYMGNTFQINGITIAVFLIAIVMGIPIHSIYRGYLVLKYKYKPED